jgi:hypothetical protein
MRNSFRTAALYGETVEMLEVHALPDRYFLRIIDEEVRLAVDVGNEECEHDVDSEEPVHDIVHDEGGPRQVPQERKLQWAYPRRVYHQEDQERLPDPAASQRSAAQLTNS